MSNRVLLFMIMVNLLGCYGVPSFLSQSDEVDVLDAESVTSSIPEPGISVGQFSAKSNKLQVLQADPDSAIASTKVSIGPGTLAIDTEIIIQEGVSLTPELAKANLDLPGNLSMESASPSVIIEASNGQDALKPFTISLEVNAESSLKLVNPTTYLAILYNIKVVGSNDRTIGIIPTQQLRIQGNTVEFSLANWGEARVVRLNAPISEPIAQTTELEPVTKIAAKSAPIEISDIRPYAIARGKSVEISGKNFLPTMTLAVNDVNVKNMKVASDSRASFTLPDETKFGFATLVAQVADQKVQQKFFALADKTNYPLMTVDPVGICEGVKYYDAAGNLREGSKSCNSAPAFDMTAYDANGDGIIDMAASFVTDRGNISAASTLNVGNIGTFFNVTGDATVTAISPRTRGTVITLGASGNLSIQASTSILSNKYKTLFLGPGDFAELTSVGAGIWILGNTFHSPKLHLQVGGNNSLAPHNNQYTPIEINFYSEIIDTYGLFSESISNQWSGPSSTREMAIEIFLKINGANISNSLCTSIGSFSIVAHDNTHIIGLNCSIEDASPVFRNSPDASVKLETGKTYKLVFNHYSTYGQGSEDMSLDSSSYIVLRNR